MADPLDNAFAREHWGDRRDVLIQDYSQLPTDPQKVIDLIQSAVEAVPAEYRDSLVFSWSDQFAMIPGLHLFYYAVKEVVA